MKPSLQYQLLKTRLHSDRDRGNPKHCTRLDIRMKPSLQY